MLSTTIVGNVLRIISLEEQTYELEILENSEFFFKMSKHIIMCVCKGTGGSVVEFTPATREARVRFPASARPFYYFFVCIFLI